MNYRFFSLGRASNFFSFRLELPTLLISKPLNPFKITKFFAISNKPEIEDLQKARDERLKKSSSAIPYRKYPILNSISYRHMRDGDFAITNILL